VEKKCKKEGREVSEEDMRRCKHFEEEVLYILERNCYGVEMRFTCP
jgi:hypothetical protein